jgi:hypothetical protein
MGHIAEDNNKVVFFALKLLLFKNLETKIRQSKLIRDVKYKIEDP